MAIKLDEYVDTWFETIVLADGTKKWQTYHMVQNALTLHIPCTYRDTIIDEEE